MDFSLAGVSQSIGDNTQVLTLPTHRRGTYSKLSCQPFSRLHRIRSDAERPQAATHRYLIPSAISSPLSTGPSPATGS